MKIDANFGSVVSSGSFQYSYLFKGKKFTCIVVCRKKMANRILTYLIRSFLKVSKNFSSIVSVSVFANKTVMEIENL